MLYAAEYQLDGDESVADMAASFATEPSQVQWQDNIGFQIKWDGDAVGEITVEGSNNHDPAKHVQGDFYSLTFDPVLAQPAGVSGGYLININQFPFQWIRVAYASDSGAGSFECWLTSKEI